MKLKVENLGVLKQAEVDFSRPLTVLTGPNNSGKTYMLYIYYGATRQFGLLKDISIEDLARRMRGSFKYSYPGKYIELKASNWLTYSIKALSSRVNESLVDLFSVPPTFFRGGLKIDVLPSIVKSDLQIFEAVKQFMVDTGIEDKPSRFISTINKIIEDKTLVKYNPMNIDSMGYNIQSELAFNFIIAFIIRNYFYINNNSFILTAERLTVDLFSKELSMQRNELVDQLIDMSKRNSKDAFDLLAKRAKRYSKPIRDSLYIAEDKQAISKVDSDLSHLAKEIEALISGEIVTSKYGELEYRPKGNKKTIPLHMGSAAVKALSSVVFYVRHLVNKGDTLFIDEPELSLHPDNQRKMAHIIALLVQNGVKVVCSTHSDYFVGELNRLIMLGSAPEGRITPQHLKDLSEGDVVDYATAPLLKKEDVGAYFFDQGTAKELKVDGYGFGIESIDEQIRKTNALNMRITNLIADDYVADTDNSEYY